MADARTRRWLLDPDGTWPGPWAFVIVASSSGVTYEQQCDGIATDLRALEGFLVPLLGVDCLALHAVFHPNRKTCLYGQPLDTHRRGALASAVGAIRYWPTDARAPVTLTLDAARADELCEAWVPVLTPDGPGVLVWNNCD